MNRSNCSRIVLLPLLATLVCMSGCGTATYEEQMQTTLAELRTIKRARVSLDDLYGYVDDRNPLSGGVVNVRLPLVFDTVFNIYSKDPSSGLPVDPSKLYPAGVELVGYNRTYEATTEDAEGSIWPYYLYIAIRAVPKGVTDQVAIELLEKFRTVATKLPERWEEIEIKTPQKSVMSWKKVTLEGDFFFDKYRADGSADWSKYPGVVDLYLYQGSGLQVLLGCQQLKGFQSVTLLDELMPLTAGTLLIEGASPEPASDSQPEPAAEDES